MKTDSRFVTSRVSITFWVTHVRTAVSDDRASVVMDCNSSPTAEMIWSLMVAARVWLLSGTPPQQMHANGADGDRREDEGRDGAADTNAQRLSWLPGLLTQYAKS